MDAQRLGKSANGGGFGRLPSLARLVRQRSDTGAAVADATVAHQAAADASAQRAAALPAATAHDAAAVRAKGSGQATSALTAKGDSQATGALKACTWGGSPARFTAAPQLGPVTPARPVQTVALAGAGTRALSPRASKTAGRGACFAGRGASLAAAMVPAAGRSPEVGADRCTLTVATAATATMEAARCGTSSTLFQRAAARATPTDQPARSATDLCAWAASGGACQDGARAPTHAATHAPPTPERRTTR